MEQQAIPDLESGLVQTTKVSARSVTSMTKSVIAVAIAVFALVGSIAWFTTRADSAESVQGRHLSDECTETEECESECNQLPLTCIQRAYLKFLSDLSDEGKIGDSDGDNDDKIAFFSDKAAKRYPGIISGVKAKDGDKRERRDQFTVVLAERANVCEANRGHAAQIEGFRQTLQSAGNNMLFDADFTEKQLVTLVRTFKHPDSGETEGWQLRAVLNLRGNEMYGNEKYPESCSLQAKFLAANPGVDENELRFACSLQPGSGLNDGCTWEAQK